MRLADKRSRLSIDIPTEERLWLKLVATAQNRSINDFVLSCIREHMPCNIEHIPNKKTAAILKKSNANKGTLSFKTPSEMFEYLGLSTKCLTQNSPKVLKKISKKRSVKKKI